MPGRRLFFQGEMSFLAKRVAYDRKHEKGMQGWSLWIFRNIALLKSFYHLFKREKISHKVKKFLQHKFWSNLVSILHMFIHKFYTDCNLRMKKGKMSQWNIKLKNCSDHVYSAYCNEHSKIFFSSHVSLQSSEQGNALRVYMQNEQHRWHTLKPHPQKNQCSHAMPLVPGLFDKVSRD